MNARDAVWASILTLARRRFGAYTKKILPTKLQHTKTQTEFENPNPAAGLEILQRAIDFGEVDADSLYRTEFARPPNRPLAKLNAASPITTREM